MSPLSRRTRFSSPLRGRLVSGLALAVVVTVPVVLTGSPSAQAADGAFDAPVLYPAGDSPQSVAVADFDGDGHPDLAVAASISNSVAILLGAANGTFGATTYLSTGALPYAVATGDFDGDGDPDVVSANSTGDNVSVFLNDGTGGFGARTNFSAGNEPGSVAVADLNGDGDPDLAVSNGLSNNVSVLLGMPGGGFGPKTDFPAGSIPYSVVVADFDGDTHLDLAVANQVPAGSVSVLLGNGSGGFGAKTDFPVGIEPTALEVGYFNGDTDPDLVAVNISSDTVSVLLGAAGGGFAPKTDFGTGSLPVAVAVGDFDDDAHSDLAVVNFAGDSISVLRGDGAGGFAPRADLPLVGAPGTFYILATSVAVADFNGDSDPDLAVAQSSGGAVSVLLGKPLPVPAFSVSPSSQAFGSVAVGAASAFEPLTVTNTGTAALAISSVAVAGADPSEFEINADAGTDTCTGASVVPAGSCTVQVRFVPTSVGAKAAVLRFADNATGSPHEVGLSGAGVPAPLPGQVITFTSAAPIDARVGGGYSPTATGGGSGNPVVLTVIPASVGVCSMVAGTVRFEHVGTCVVRADQAGNGSYSPGEGTQSIQVGKGTQSIGFTTMPPVSPKPGDTYTPQAQGGASGRPVVLAVASSSAGSCSISGGTVTFESPGACVLTADQTGDADYQPAPQASQTVEVEQPVVDPRITAAVTSTRASIRGWYRTPVRVSFACTPGSAALVGGCPDPVTLSGSGANQHLIRTVTGVDGGQATVRVAGIDIDRVRPGVRVTRVTNGGTYPTARTIRCRATDQHSGVLSCVVTTRRHRQADGDVVVRYRATATDNAGNQRTKRGHYTIDR